MKIRRLMVVGGVVAAWSFLCFTSALASTQLWIFNHSVSSVMVSTISATGSMSFTAKQTTVLPLQNALVGVIHDGGFPSPGGLVLKLKYPWYGSSFLAFTTGPYCVYIQGKGNVGASLADLVVTNPNFGNSHFPFGAKYFTTNWETGNLQPAQLVVVVNSKVQSASSATNNIPISYVDCAI